MMKPWHKKLLDKLASPVVLGIASSLRNDPKDWIEEWDGTIEHVTNTFFVMSDSNGTDIVNCQTMTVSIACNPLESLIIKYSLWRLRRHKRSPLMVA